MSIIKKIKKLENHRSLILREIKGISHMIRGSYGETYRKCGKMTCWCYEGEKGHPIYRITWTKEARPGTKAIPKVDIAWIKKMTRNYKRCRTLRADLRKLEQELRILIDNLEDNVIKKTEKLRKYFKKNIPKASAGGVSMF